MKKLAIIIPARMQSTRFPGKVMYPILGTPLVIRVAEAARECSHADRVIIATDNEKIMETAKLAGFEARMTSPDHPSGTDRVWEVAQSLDEDWILNLQGDEPLITGEDLDSLAEVVMSDDGADNEIVTLVSPLEPREANDPNRVKVVTDRDMNALYFSRSPIPYLKERPIEQEHDGVTFEYLLHVGLYLYRRDILEKFIGMKQTPLETAEGLEQLRALENGMRIRCVITDNEFMGVDKKTDVPKVEAMLRARAAESQQ